MVTTQDTALLGFLNGDTLSLVAGAAMMLVLFLLWKAFSGTEMSSRRIASVTRRRDELRADLRARGKGGSRRAAMLNADSVQKLARYLKRMPWLYSKEVKTLLLRAGKRGKDAAALYTLVKFGAPVALFVVGFLLVNILGLAHGKPLFKLLVLFGLPLLAFMLPGMLLKNAIQKREQALRRGMPDALDLLVICAESGLGLDAALDRVAREMNLAQPILAEELGLTAVELGFMPERRVALAGLAERVQLPAVRTLVNTLIQSEKYGTPLAQALRVMSAELRDERMMKAEEKAAKLPATLTVPMILLILPTLFIVMLGPAVIQVLDLNKPKPAAAAKR